MRVTGPDIMALSYELEGTLATEEADAVGGWQDVSPQKSSLSPFYFLIRTGTEMGLEDYRTKPVSDQSLIATIKDMIKQDRHITNRRTARRVALLGALETPKSLVRPPVHTNRTAGCPNRRGSSTSALSPSRSSTPSSAFAE